MTRISIAYVFFLLASLGIVAADRLPNITPARGSANALHWQPVLDFESDTCYHTSAIESSGKTNYGLKPSSSEDECRRKNRLENCNTYAREHCRKGWCVYMYGYYTEMDWSFFSSHRHDWEHAMVWTRGGEPWSVMWSAHGKYNDGDPNDDILWEGSHPKLVAHHGTANTGSLRRATPFDKAPLNVMKKWIRCPLQQFGQMDRKVWDKLIGTNWGGAHMDLAPARFKDMLNKYMPKQAREDGFTAPA